MSLPSITPALPNELFTALSPLSSSSRTLLSKPHTPPSRSCSLKHPNLSQTPFALCRKNTHTIKQTSHSHANLIRPQAVQALSKRPQSLSNTLISLRHPNLSQASFPLCRKSTHTIKQTLYPSQAPSSPCTTLPKPPLTLCNPLTFNKTGYSEISDISTCTLPPLQAG